MQLQRISEELEKQGYTTYMSKVNYFPFHIFSDRLTQYEMRMAMAFQFARHYLELIPNLEAQKVDWLLCDRHYICHLAFAATYGLGWKEIERLADIFRLGGTPDLTFYFDVPLEVSLDRIHNRKSKKIAEDETPEILGATLENYQRIVRMNPTDPLVCIDATDSVEIQTEQILRYISEL